MQDICHELNELRQYDILNALPKLIKDSPTEGYVVDSNAFDECMDKVLYLSLIHILLLSEERVTVAHGTAEDTTDDVTCLGIPMLIVSNSLFGIIMHSLLCGDMEDIALSASVL